MTIETMFMVMLIIIVGMAWWANYGKRNKIYCTFDRRNKTQISKFVKMTSRYVIFDNQRFDIVPSCIVFRWWDAGLVHMLFPQWVATLNFVWSNRFPKDPNTNMPAVISPEVRKAMDKEEWVKSYAKNFTPPSSKKQTAFQQYLPYISLLAVLVVAVVAYNWISGINVNMADLANRINAIAK